MRLLYQVYVNAGTILKNGIEHKLKKEFNQYLEKKDALDYKTRLEKRYDDVVIVEKKIKDNPFS